PDLEVRGGQLEASVLGLEQDVRQDRQRSVRDRPAHDRQTASEVLLHDRELHVSFTPRAFVTGHPQRSTAARPPRSETEHISPSSGEASPPIGPRISWVSSPYLLTPSSPSSWCGRC